ncbi:Transposon Ty3-G Gag-Pol polyprotein [Halotydeus destructor]|nr:Transposon Ty3-G Gag-Pol polyprotein [Halotydeus destructor]
MAAELSTGGTDWVNLGPRNLSTYSGTIKADAELAECKISFNGDTKKILISKCPSEDTKVTLGMNFLIGFKMSINFEKRLLYSMKTKKRWYVPVSKVSKEQPKEEVRSRKEAEKVLRQTKKLFKTASTSPAEKKDSSDELFYFVTKHNSTLPASCRAVVEISCARENEEAVLECSGPAGLFYRKKCRIASSLVTPNQKLLVMTNFSRKPEVIKSGTVIAVGRKCQKVENFRIVSSDNGKLKSEFDKHEEQEQDSGIETDCSSDSEPEMGNMSNEFEDKWHSFCASDYVRRIFKNKTIPNYPRVFNPSDKVCQDMVTRARKAEMSSHRKGQKSNSSSDRGESFTMSSFNINRALEPEKVARLEDFVRKNMSVFAMTNDDIMMKNPNLEPMKIDTECETILTTDACDEGLGGVLEQEEITADGKKKRRVIAYWGAGLNVHERKYMTTDKELLAVMKAIEHFDVYLRGRHFTLYTDHSALLSLNNAKDKKGRLGRYAVLLEDYTYTVHHRPGLKNMNADVISRMPMEPVLEHKEPFEDRGCWKAANELEEPEKDVGHKLSKCQLADPYCNAKMKMLDVSNLHRNVRKRERQKFKVIDKVLHRVLRQPGAERQVFPVVPKVLVKEVLEGMHSSVTGGHSGQRRTIAKTRLSYWWPGMTKDIISFIRRCEHCQFKKKPRRKLGKLKPLAHLIDDSNEVIRPFSIIGFDIVCLPSHQTKNKNMYILVAVDYVTRYVICAAYSKITAADCKHFILNEVVPIGSFPEIMITDRGTQLTSAELAEALNEFGIEHRFTSGYHPETNGLCERYNGIIKEMLSAVVSDTQKNWDNYLKPIQFALNATPNSVTQYSPFYLYTGMVPRFPIDNELQRKSYVSDEEVKNPDKWLIDLHEARRLAVRRIKGAAIKMKSHVDKRRSLPNFKENDLVLKLKPLIPQGQCPGFYKPYEGPFLITKAFEDGLNYVITSCGNPEDSRVVNVNTLKKYFSDDQDLLIPVEPLEEPAAIQTKAIVKLPAAVKSAEELRASKKDQTVENVQPPPPLILNRPIHQYQTLPAIIPKDAESLPLRTEFLETRPMPTLRGPFGCEKVKQDGAIENPDEEKAEAIPKRKYTKRVWPSTKEKILTRNEAKLRKRETEEEAEKCVDDEHFHLRCFSE